MSNNHLKASWLQLSDLHVFNEAQKNSMLNDYKKLANIIHPDFIVVTGDFQHQRFPDEATIQNAQDYLEKIIQFFGVQKENVFLVPGNHDASGAKDYRRKQVISQICKEIDKDYTCYKKYIEDPQYPLLTAFQEYAQFVKAFYGDSVDDRRIKTPSDPFVLTWNHKLNILHINTALISDGEKDAHKDIVDINQIYARGENELDPSLPTIMIGHHGLDSLYTSHRELLEKFIADYSVSAYLHGDIHKYRDIPIRDIGDPNRSIPEIACGKSAPQATDTYSDVGVIYYKWDHADITTVEAYQWSKNGFSRRTDYPFMYLVEKYYSFPMKYSALDDTSREEGKEPDNTTASDAQHSSGWTVVSDPGAISPPQTGTDLSCVYWVGTRLSDIDGFADRFKGCVVLFGDKHDPRNNRYVMCPSRSTVRVDHNDPNDLSQDRFIAESISKIVERDPDARFMFYNPSTIYRLGFPKDFIQRHAICLNSRELLDRINNKAEFRKMMRSDAADPNKRLVAMLPILQRSRINCDYEELVQEKENGAFDDSNNYGYTPKAIAYDDNLRFIVQAPIASGGAGTFILNKQNARYLLSSLDPRADYLVSVYHTRNVPVNIHVLIADNGYVLLPASVQLEREVEIENKLLYKGADFPVYRQLDQSLRQHFQQQVQNVAQKLKEEGYRGVFGVDAIIHNGRVNILEVNARFQASTELINRALLEAGHKTIQELNVQCFSKTGLSDDDKEIFKHLSVDYSNYSFSNEGHRMHDTHVYEKALDAKSTAIQADGYSEQCGEKYIVQAHLFRLVFSGSIASISKDGTVWINENISPPDAWLFRKIKAREKLAVKLALLIQGIRIHPEISRTLREATNNAVDLQFGTDKKNIMIVNSPTAIRYVEFSPFELVHSAFYPGKYLIIYYGAPLIDNVGIFPADSKQQMVCKSSGRRYSEIAYLSTDRLRVHLTNACRFKPHNSCKFCNIQIDKNTAPIALEDIREVVQSYMDDKRVREKAGELITLKHFLIGGQSLENCDSQLIGTAKILSSYRLPVYVMTLPLKESTVRALVKLGVLEYAYNIEIFDEKCRKEFMPGKSRIPVETYLDALKMTRRILNGAPFPSMLKVVRSMVIVGLEPWGSMVDGIQKLIDIRVEPMLSVFRPLPGTALEHLNAPPIRMVYDLFHLVNEKLYAGSQIDDEELIEWTDDAAELTGTITDYRKLGPECPCCQNNTVSLPWELQKAVIRRTALTVDEDYACFSAADEKKKSQ